MREGLKTRRENETFEFRWQGMKFTATIARFGDNRLAEIFLTNDDLYSDFILKALLADLVALISSFYAIYERVVDIGKFVFPFRFLVLYIRLAKWI